MTTSEMEAGREMDAAVIRSVFKRRVSWWSLYPWEEAKGEWRPSTYGMECLLPNDKGDMPMLEMFTDGGWEPVPFVSTDIAAAWLVVEKMSELGWYFNIATTDPYDVTFSVDVRDERHGTWNEFGQEDGWITHDVRADTAPLAICRAARMAVE